MTATLDEKQYSVQSFRIKYKANEPPPKKRDLLTSPQGVVNMARHIFAELDGGMSIEQFGVCYLNCQNELIGFKAVSTGTIDQVAVYPRMIIHTGLMVGAAGVILIHNHPSGYVSPSDNDKQLTKTIKEGARIMDIRVLDHLVISQSGEYYSFAERGLL